MPFERSHASFAASSQFPGHEVSPLERRRSVELAGHGLGGAGRLARGLERLAGAKQGLGRNTCPVVALAADQAALHDRNRQASACEAVGAMLAGGPRSDDDDVVLAHSDRHRPGARVFTSWSTQPLPSGSPKLANEP